MRIIHLTATANGAPWMIDMAREQRRRGHEVAVIIPSASGTIAPALERQGIRYYLAQCDVLSAPGTIARVRVIASLVRLLRRLKPDVLHSHLIGSVATARIAGWIADVPIRFGANAGPLTMESDLLRPVEVGTAEFDTRTIASCSYTLELFDRHGIPRSQCDLVYYGPDEERFDPANADRARVRRELGIADHTPLIGIVAYFYAPSRSSGVYGHEFAGRGMKGHEVLLDAVPLVLREYPAARFALVGGGWGPEGQRYMQKVMARAKPLGDAVLFAGERKDVADVLASFDISVHPSLSDNLGGTIESLLMAKPMVVSDIPGYADSVTHEETGLVVPRDDAAALAEAIIRLLRDRELARRLAENGRARMLELFTTRRAADKLDAMFARENARAETHYRIGTTLARAAAMPAKLLPILAEVKRATKRHRRVRVAQVAGIWEDAEWFVALCRDLIERGYDVIAVIDKRRGDLGPRLEAAGIPFYRVALTFATRLDRTRLPVYAMKMPVAGLRLVRILRSEGIDIVHSHVFATVAVARVAAKLAGARHVAGVAGPRHLEAPLTRAIDRYTWWMDDVTVAGCQYTLDLYEALGASGARTTCIYYGVDPERFDPSRADPVGARQALGIGPGDRLITLVAHFYPPTFGTQTAPHTAGRGLKGQEDFLAAARIVQQRFPEAWFVLAGSGLIESGEKYRHDLIARFASARIVFPGHVSDVPSLLAASDVAVQCSLTENLGGTIEALLMERPVVATRVGGMPESVRDRETGLLVPPADPAALASAIIELLENQAQAAKFARAGRKLMLERFTSTRMADDVAMLYRRLVPAPA